MKYTVVVSALLALASLAHGAKTPAPIKIAPDCSQAQRQLVNKLLRQDVNPAKACYAKAKGDITFLSTSRLCPIAECNTWLQYMAQNAPDCMYDDTNYGRDFKDKAKDCEDPSSSGGSAATETPAKTKKPVPPTLSSTSGSSSEAGVETPAPSSASGSGSIGVEIEDEGSTIIEPQVTEEPPTEAPPAPVVTPKSSATTLAASAVTLTVAAVALVL